MTHSLQSLRTFRGLYFCISDFFFCLFFFQSLPVHPPPHNPPLPFLFPSFLPCCFHPLLVVSLVLSTSCRDGGNCHTRQSLGFLGGFFASRFNCAVFLGCFGGHSQPRWVASAWRTVWQLFCSPPRWPRSCSSQTDLIRGERDSREETETRFLALTSTQSTPHPPPPHFRFLCLFEPCAATNKMTSLRCLLLWLLSQGALYVHQVSLAEFCVVWLLLLFIVLFLFFFYLNIQKDSLYQWCPKCFLRAILMISFLS